MNSNEVREIPPAIQRTFLELRSNESFRTALEWLMNEWSVSRDIGRPDESADYRKGVQDAFLLQANLTGLRFTQSLETDAEQRNDESNDE